MLDADLVLNVFGMHACIFWIGDMNVPININFIRVGINVESRSLRNLTIMWNVCFIEIPRGTRLMKLLVSIPE